MKAPNMNDRFILPFSRTRVDVLLLKVRLYVDRICSNMHLKNLNNAI